MRWNLISQSFEQIWGMWLHISAEPPSIDPWSSTKLADREPEQVCLVCEAESSGHNIYSSLGSLQDWADSWTILDSGSDTVLYIRKFESQDKRQQYKRSEDHVSVQVFLRLFLSHSIHTCIYLSSWLSCSIIAVLWPHILLWIVIPFKINPKNLLVSMNSSILQNC